MIKHEIKLRASAALFIAFYALLLSGCSKEHAPVSAEEPVVSGDTIRFPADSPLLNHLITAPVMSEQYSVISLPARIVWDEDHTSRIAPPVAGRLEDVMVQPGALVKPNQALAYLSSPELGSVQTESARAQAELAQAERTLERTSNLYAVSGVAAKDLEQAQLDLIRARAEAERTSLHLKTLGATGTVDQRFTVRSPVAGVVVERNTNPGLEWRPDQPGAPLFVISDPTYLWCWIDAPENMLNLLHPGMKVTLHAGNRPDETYKAQIDYVGDALDPTSRTIKVRARLRNPGRHLKGEMYVTAELTSHDRGLLDVPVKAVFLNQEAHQVFVRTADGQYTRKTIAPVETNDKWVSISQGLDKGEETVVDGALYLQKLLDDNSPPGTGDASQPAPADNRPAK